RRRGPPRDLRLPGLTGSGSVRVFAPRNAPIRRGDASERDQATETERRRRFRMRRRSRSDVPPHTPWSIRLRRAYSRHGALTGQVVQIRRARSTPTPSLGKNTAGGWLRQLPSAIHPVSVSSYIVSPVGRRLRKR